VIAVGVELLLQVVGVAVAGIDSVACGDAVAKADDGGTGIGCVCTDVQEQKQGKKRKQ